MKKHRETPIFKKSQEIFETVKAITDLFPEDNEHLAYYKAQLLSDAMIIQAKLSGAKAVKIYDLKMENAAIIRKAARDLMVAYHGLRSEEHTSELQSRENLVCRLLLEKKKTTLTI